VLPSESCPYHALIVHRSIPNLLSYTGVRARGSPTRDIADYGNSDAPIGQP
jgi:hypothetical protein